MAAFNENDVHKHLFVTGLEAVVQDCPLFDAPLVLPASPSGHEEDDFALWRIIKGRAFAKLQRLHRTVRYGTFVGSKITMTLGGEGGAMELDLLGTHEDGLFVLELKIGKSAERNAFSELFAYSNYIAGMFALSGHQDIANVLVASLDNQITRQAFLYDLLINDRDIIVYKPVFPDGTATSLKLELYLPSDEDFRHLTNELLSHHAMACVVISFHDLEGWFDSEEDNGSLNGTTRKHLSALSTYAAQLMEAERLHGFCFIRKPWAEHPRYYRNSLFICALNPFRIAAPERANEITVQIEPSLHSEFFDTPEMAFDGRLIRIAQRAVRDSFTHDYGGECETPFWGGIVTEMQEVVFTHNFGFRPTGMFREAYVGFLSAIYARKDAGDENIDDVDMLKINEINSWFRAWEFMENCGFKAGQADEGGEDLADEDWGDEAASEP